MIRGDLPSQELAEALNELRAQLDSLVAGLGELGPMERASYLPRAEHLCRGLDTVLSDAEETIMGPLTRRKGYPSRSTH